MVLENISVTTVIVFHVAGDVILIMTAMIFLMSEIVVCH